jgi:hypothetical protein
MDSCTETPAPGVQDQGYKAFTRIIAARSASQLVTRYNIPSGSHEKKLNRIQNQGNKK